MSAIRWCAALVLASGCSLVLSYPEPALESDATACANRTDDDLDGAIDCDDPDCGETPACEEVGPVACSDGVDNDRNGDVDCADERCHCPETSLALCTSARDEDADGLIDASDPGCWPAQRTSITRCASSAAIDHELSYAAVLGGAWYLASASAVEVRTAPPIGLELWSANDRPAVLGVRRTVPLRASESTLEGAIVSNEATDDSERTRRIWLALVPAGLAPDGAAPLPGAREAGIVLEIDYDRATVELRAPDASSSVPFATYGELEVLIDISAGRAGASITDARGDRVVLPRVDVASDALEWRMIAGLDGHAIILRSRFRATPNDPCGRRVPEIPSGRDFGDESGLLDVGRAVSVARGAGGYCAIALGCERQGFEVVRTLTAWSSVDGLVWREASAPASPRSGESIAAAGIGWDPDAGRYRLAVARASGADRAATISTIAGADCGAWEAEQDAGLPPVVLDGALSCDTLDPAAGLSYVVRRRGDERVHELWLTGERGLERASSSDAVAFALDLAPASDERLVPPVAVHAIGERDLVRVRPSGADTPGLIVEVAADEEGIAWRGVGAGALLVASGEPATFDSDAVLSGTIAPLDDGTYLVLHGASGDFVARRGDGHGYVSVGSAVLELTPLEEP